MKHLELFSHCHVTVYILTDEELDQRLKGIKAEEETEDNWRKCGKCILYPFVLIGMFFYYLFKCLCCFLECMDD